MASIEDDPIRLESPGLYARGKLPVDQEAPLPPPLELAGSFRSALSRRRSAEVFAPISDEELSSWLYYVHATQAVNSDDPNRQRRFVASFGGLHPTSILLGRPSGVWATYVPERHVLGLLEVDSSSAAALRARAQQCFQTADATLVVLLTNSDLATHYYINPLGLMLRDAGVLLGHAALVAASLGIAFRILGSTGTPFVEGLLPALPFRPVATGLAWVGGRCGG
jgi:hypothetical protein